MKMRPYKILISGLLAVSLAACQTTGGQGPASPLDTLASRDVLTAAAVGAAVGGLIGGIVGNNVGDGNAVRGVAIGAAAGALLGAGAGAVAANRREQYATEKEYIDDEIRAASSAISAKEVQIAETERALAAERSTLASIRAEGRTTASTRAAAQESSNRLRQQIQQQDKTLREYEEAIAYIEEVERTSQPKAGEDLNALKRRQETLALKEKELKNQYNRLNGIRDESAMILREAEVLGRG